MRRILVFGLLLVALALLGAGLDLIGAWKGKWVQGFLVASALCVTVFCLWRIFTWQINRQEVHVDPWICSACGEYETRYVRQCGACEAFRVPRLTTEQLVLREWRDFDLESFAEINADPQVMQFTPGPLGRAESDELAARIREDFAKRGLGLWAVEVPGVAPFIGYIGLAIPRFEAPFTPCVELQCRLAVDHWGLGYATEGARAALDYGLKQARLGEIVAITVLSNLRSVRVLEKLGMSRDPAEDFDHPAYPPGHRLRRHVLYRVSR